MKASDLMKVAKRCVLPHLPSFKVKGTTILYEAPIGLFLRALHFQTSSLDPQRFTVWAFVQPLYIPRDHFVLNIGGRLGWLLGDRDIWWCWDAEDTDFQEQVMRDVLQYIRQVGLPFLQKFQTPKDVIRWLRKLDAGERAKVWHDEILVCSLILEGDYRGAQRLISRVYPELLRHIHDEPWRLEIAERLMLLQTLLQQSPEDAIKQLYAWRQWTLKQLRLEKEIGQEFAQEPKSECQLDPNRAITTTRKDKGEPEPASDFKPIATVQAPPLRTVQLMQLAKKYLLPHLPAFRAKSDMLYVTPVGMMLRGFHFQLSQLDHRSFTVEMFVEPLYVPLSYVSFACRVRLGQQRGSEPKWWSWDPAHPEQAEAVFAEVLAHIQREGLPLLERFREPRDLLHHAKRVFGKEALDDEWMAYTLVMAGAYRKAQKILLRFYQLESQILEMGWASDSLLLARRVLEALREAPEEAVRLLEEVRNQRLQALKIVAEGEERLRSSG